MKSTLWVGNLHKENITPMHGRGLDKHSSYTSGRSIYEETLLNYTFYDSVINCHREGENKLS